MSALGPRYPVCMPQFYARLHALSELAEESSCLAAGQPQLARNLAAVPCIREFQVRSPASIVADRLVEPKDSGTVDMLSALPPEEDLSGTSDVLLAEIESRVSFVGGSRSEYILYFCRQDLPEGMWLMRPAAEARTVAGFSVRQSCKQTGTRSESCSWRWRPTRSGQIRGAVAAWACTAEASSTGWRHRQVSGPFPRLTRRTRLVV